MLRTDSFSFEDLNAYIKINYHLTNGSISSLNTLYIHMKNTSIKRRK